MLTCPDCNSLKVNGIGWIITRHGYKHRYKCCNCGRTFYDPEEQIQPLEGGE